MPSRDTPSLNVRLPQKLKDALQRLADAEQRTLSNYVVLVLSQHVEEAEGKGKRR